MAFLLSPALCRRMLSHDYLDGSVDNFLCREYSLLELESGPIFDAFFICAIVALPGADDNSSQHFLQF